MTNSEQTPIKHLEQPLPSGFDAARHTDQLTALVNQEYDGDWALQVIDPRRRVAIYVPQRTASEIRDQDDKTIVVGLPRTTKPSDGQKVASQYEDQYRGFYMTKFDPFLFLAEFERMDENTVRARGALANALGCKPWEVGITPRIDGGFDVKLPSTYAPGKHDKKLDEATTQVIGQFGWYIQISPQTLTATIIPADPPTFPPVIPLDLKKLGKGTLDRTPFALRLPKSGEKAKEIVAVDWTMNPYLLLGGLPRSGKSVTINDIIADCRSNGSEIVIVTTPDKAVDFAWARPYVREGGWGCASHRHAITAISLAYEELKRRAAILDKRGLQNWYQIPESERFAPITIIVDEVSMMLMTDRLPAGVDKKLPEVQEIIEMNRLKFKLQSLIYKTMAELGFVGARVLLSTQVTNATTGLPPTMKSLMGNKALQGSNPSKTQREQAFNQAMQVPEVPENLRAGGAAAKGVGAAEFEGQSPTIYKPFYANTDDIVARFEELGIAKAKHPEPTEEEMDRLCPTNDDMGEDEEPRANTPSGKPLDPKFGPQIVTDGDGRRLFGAAAAASASKKIADLKDDSVTLESSDLPMCPSCGKPIQPDGTCGCSR